MKKKDFSKRLKYAMIMSGFTVSSLSEGLGCSYFTVRNWLSGEALPSVEYLYKLCVALSVSADELLGLYGSQIDTATLEIESPVVDDRLPIEKTYEIKNAIRCSGIPQWAVAEALGVNPSTLCVWLRGRITQEKYDRINNALNS